MYGKAYLDVEQPDKSYLQKLLIFTCVVEIKYFSGILHNSHLVVHNLII